MHSGFPSCRLSRAHICAALLTVFFGCQVSLLGQTVDFDELQKQVASTIENVQPSVVAISDRRTSFSGVIVSAEGHVLSAGHTVQPNQKYRVRLVDGRVFTGQGMGSNMQLDCGLIKIETEEALPVALMGDSANLVINQPVIGLSYPGGSSRSSRTPVARFGRIVRTAENRRMIQSTATMEPGDSGGPLFDLNGHVIGIHSQIGRSIERNYDVPVATFKKYWNELNYPAAFGDIYSLLPKFGFQFGETRNGGPLQVVEVFENSLAKKHGLQADDQIVRVHKTEVDSVRRFRRALVDAYNEKTDEVQFVIRRDGKAKTIKFPFEVKRPEVVAVPLPPMANASQSKPIPQLARLPQQFSELESKLDDSMVQISSQFGDRKLKIFGTRIDESDLIVSKSSMVSEDAYLLRGGKRIELEIVERDKTNDLVLLRAPETTDNGVDFANSQQKTSKVGNFIITPDPIGAGVVSLRSSSNFKSRKRASRGFLGVFPQDSENGGALLATVDEGAAKSAGLKPGDVITKMDETKIESSKQLRAFLANCDPNEPVIATFNRAGKTLERTIHLGSFQEQSNHAADMMEKSGRRDGFEQVFSHDANLRPSECGSPAFDTDGNVLGLNIARHSRVRSFVIPARIVNELVSRHLSK